MNYGEDGEPVSVEFINASAKGLVERGEVSIILQAESLRAYGEAGQ
jgi:hypothetical protein